MGWAVELWELCGGTIGVLKAHVPLLYISSSFITARRCAPHTCKAAFLMESGGGGGGKVEEQCQKGR